MPRLPHSPTNDTSKDGNAVTKSYAGPDAALRRAREAAAVRGACRAHRPVPEPLDGGETWRSFASCRACTARS